MSETPTHDHVASYMEPLIKSSERIGSVRALLMLNQWILDEVKTGNIKLTPSVQHILTGMEKIREDILLRKANRG
jgi:hypothetical protein